MKDEKKEHMLNFERHLTIYIKRTLNSHNDIRYPLCITYMNLLYF